MNQKAGQNGLLAGAHPREHNSHNHDDRDVSPAAPELSGMEGSENQAGDDDASGNASTARDDRIKKTAEDGLLDKGRDENGEYAEQDDAFPRFDHFFDRKRLFLRNQAIDGGGEH